MWCVVYAGDGRELKTEDFIKKLLPETVYKRCFHLVQRLVYKKQGRLRDVERKCFPGYVFIETDEPDVVQKTLESTPKNLLFSDSRHVSTLSKEEETLFGLIVDNNGKIGLSVVTKAAVSGSGKKKVEYLAGPLTKVADQVIHVDLHKRYAQISGLFMDGKGPLRLGFRYVGEEIWSEG